VEGNVYSSVGAGTAGEHVVTGVALACSGFVQDTFRSCP